MPLRLPIDRIPWMHISSPVLFFSFTPHHPDRQRIRYCLSSGLSYPLLIPACP
jgi:hypothetical protein